MKFTVFLLCLLPLGLAILAPRMALKPQYIKIDAPAHDFDKALGSIQK